jgi:hypothetical protein
MPASWIQACSALRFCHLFRQLRPNIEQFRGISAPDQHHFSYFSQKALLIEQQKCFQGDITKQTLGMFISRLRAQLDPYFDRTHIGAIQIKQISAFILHLQTKPSNPSPSSSI